jgi:serine O-acetyltransferase
LSTRVASSLGADALAALAARQLDAFIPDGHSVAPADLAVAVPGALARLEYCFIHIDNKYFFNGRQAVFDHLHGDQYAMWLYLLANELHLRAGPATLCKKLFLLNKALHGCDIFYEVALPSVFLLVHPLGTVLGRGEYADFLIAYQRVGVGSNHNVYPTLGRHITLHPGSSVLGRSTVGDHCSIASGSLLLDRELQPNSVYIGNPRDYLIKPRRHTFSIWRK